MRRTSYTALLLFLCFTVLCQESLRAQVPQYGTATMQAGDMTLTISRGGQIAPPLQGSADGLLWPNGPEGVQHGNRTVRRLLYSATPALVGRVRGELRASASLYGDAFLPGPILPGMKTVNPYDSRYRAFVIRIGGENDADFLDWPGELGAPVDSSFAPQFYGSPQMFWVLNDLDTVGMQKVTGCDPMGVELRCLAFPLSSLSTIADDVILLQYTYINHSQDSIRDAYAGFFADPDMREPSDEYAGSDSLRALAYVYDDDYVTPGVEGMPVAFGISMLQTPAVPGMATDSARWSNGMKTGFRNIPVTSGTVPVKSPGINIPIGEPQQGEGAEGWYALMKGEGRGTSVRNPLTGAPTGFWFSGDPLTGDGWQMDDGLLLGDDRLLNFFGKADQRIMISSGPFDLAPGDTQQVVIALIAARGATGTAAASLLRDRADFLRQYWQRNSAFSGFTSAAVRLDPQPGGGTDLRFTARSSTMVDRVEGEVTGLDGRTVLRHPLMAVQQGDDVIYTGSVSLPAMDGVDAGFNVIHGTETHRLPGRVSIPTSGAIQGRGAAILQEYDGNGRIAPDEDARWMPRLYNDGTRQLSIRIEASTLDYEQWMKIDDFPAMTLAPSEQLPWTPDFGSRTLPAVTEGWGTTSDSVSFEYDVYDVERNSWWELRNWVQVDSTAKEWYDLLMAPVQTASAQRPGVMLTDLHALQDRIYVASISSDRNGRLLSLHDSATGETLFADYALDSFNGMAPVIDGFRVVRGTIGSRYTGYFFSDVADFQPADYGMYLLRAGHSNFGEAERRDFRLEFTLDGLDYWSYAERGYEGRIRLPLRAFMRDDAGGWTPVMVALHETGSDIPDGDPNPDGGDYLLIYQLPYDAESAPEVGILPESILDMPAPLILQLTGLPTAGSCLVEYPVPVTEGDVFMFNPRHLLLASSNKPPAAATLYPPAPMPFSEWTSATLELQQAGSLRVDVYNVLGQRVRTLIDGVRDAGKYLMVWDGYWEDGRPAETGTYLLRAVTGGREITRKLLLVR